MENILGTGQFWIIWLISLLVAWEMVWKAFAMWRAARKGQLVWFVCVMVFNTIGILPIIYLLTNKEEKKVCED